MAQTGEIALWRAPTPRCQSPLLEIQQGFDPAEYPGLGLFFATYRPVADGFQVHYRNGLQEYNMLKVEFDRLLQLHVIFPDTFYPTGQSWYAPPAGLVDFNKAVEQSSAGKYYPQS